MDASINSNTSVPEYLGMPVLRFYEIWEAICSVYERKAKKRNQAVNQIRANKPRKRHRR